MDLFNPVHPVWHCLFRLDLFIKIRPVNILVFDNTTQLVTTERSEDNIRIEDVILPDSFQNQQSILFKTTHTRAEVLLDGEKIYEFGNDTDTLRFMKSPGPCWHIVDLPKTVMENTCRSGLFLYIQTTTEILSIFFGGTKRRLYPEDPEQQSLFIGSKLRILSLGIICLILCFSIMRKMINIRQMNPT